MVRRGHRLGNALVLPVDGLLVITHIADALARMRVTRTFTPEECVKYLHLDSCPAGP